MLLDKTKIKQNLKTKKKANYERIDAAETWSLELHYKSAVQLTAPPLQFGLPDGFTVALRKADKALNVHFCCSQLVGRHILLQWYK